MVSVAVAVAVAVAMGVVNVSPSRKFMSSITFQGGF